MCSAYRFTRPPVTAIPFIAKCQPFAVNAQQKAMKDTLITHARRILTSKTSVMSSAVKEGLVVPYAAACHAMASLAISRPEKPSVRPATSRRWESCGTEGRGSTSESGESQTLASIYCPSLLRQKHTLRRIGERQYNIQCRQTAHLRGPENTCGDHSAKTRRDTEDDHETNRPPQKPTATTHAEAMWHLSGKHTHIHTHHPFRSYNRGIGRISLGYKRDSYNLHEGEKTATTLAEATPHTAVTISPPDKTKHAWHF